VEEAGNKTSSSPQICCHHRRSQGVQWVHLHPQLISKNLVEFFAVFCREKYKKNRGTESTDVLRY